MSKKQPNFLLIITDQHRADHLGCTGHPTLQTPNIDGLAENGVRFRNFYVSTPVCMPNRATLMTGRMPSVHGVRHNGIPLSRQATTFVELLASAGYETALIGKSHLQTQTGNPPLSKPKAPPQGVCAPPEDLAEARRGVYDGDYGQETPGHWKQLDAKVETPFYGFSRVEISKGHGARADGDYRLWLEERHPDGTAILGPDKELPGNDYQVPQSWRTAVPEELDVSAFISDRIEAFLDERDAGKPFFAMASFPDPHHPFTPPGKYWDMYKPEDMEMPEAFSRNGWTPTPYVQELHDAHDRGDPITDIIMAHGLSQRDALEARALTCGMITCIDDAVGRMLSALEARGLSEDTIVIFTSDHGEHLGDHKLLLKGLAHYDELIRVPMIWSEQGRARNGQWIEGLSGTIDIGASILDRAGLHPYNGIQGQSFLSALDEENAELRDAVLVEDEQQRTIAGLGERPRVRTVTDGRWRMSLYHGHDWGELYDLETDPGEFENLWDASEASAERARLMEKMARLMAEACDRSPLPLHQA